MSASKWQPLRTMVEQWAQIAAHVERGYSLTFDDYLNDVDLRRLIDERIRALGESRSGAMPKSSNEAILKSPSLAIPKSLGVALAAADDVFREATTLSADNVWGADNERDEGWNAEREWYYYRWPRSLPEW